MGLTVTHSSLESSAASAGASAAGACRLSSSGHGLSYGHMVHVVAVIAVQGNRVARRCWNPAVHNQGNQKAAFVAASSRMRSSYRLQSASPLFPRHPLPIHPAAPKLRMCAADEMPPLDTTPCVFVYSHWTHETFFLGGNLKKQKRN